MAKNVSQETISAESSSESLKSPGHQVLNNKNVVGHILDKFLGDLKGVMIEQKFEIVEAVTKFETQNKYSIDSLRGQNILTAFEESSCILRHCCRSKRPFKMKIYDFDKQEILHIKRPLKCQNCCCFCCLQIFSDGVKVGKITRLWRGLLTEYLLSKVSNADIYEIMFPEGANSKLKALIISSCFLIICHATFIIGYEILKKVKTSTFLA